MRADSIPQIPQMTYFLLLHLRFFIFDLLKKQTKKSCSHSCYYHVCCTAVYIFLHVHNLRPFFLSLSLYRLVLFAVVSKNALQTNFFFFFVNLHHTHMQERVLQLFLLEKDSSLHVIT